MENETVQETEDKKPETRLVDVQINNENVALNVIVGFISLAQRRGVFNVEESAKIWECIQKFQKK